MLLVHEFCNTNYLRILFNQSCNITIYSIRSTKVVTELFILCSTKAVTLAIYLICSTRVVILAIYSTCSIKVATRTIYLIKAVTLAI